MRFSEMDSEKKREEGKREAKGRKRGQTFSDEIQQPPPVVRRQWRVDADREYSGEGRKESPEPGHENGH